MIEPDFKWTNLILNERMWIWMNEPNFKSNEPNFKWMNLILNERM